MTKTLRIHPAAGLAAVAVLLGTSAVGVVQAAPAAVQDATRPCAAPTTTVGWGAYARDRQGRCVPAASRSGTGRAAAARFETARPRACAQERRWLGGAVIVCEDASVQELAQ